jgi:hypothetical protein
VTSGRRCVCFVWALLKTEPLSDSDVMQRVSALTAVIYCVVIEVTILRWEFFSSRISKNAIILFPD